MRRVNRALVTLATALAVVAVPAAASAAPRPAPHDAALRERLDAVVSAGAVGALAEVRDGRRVWRGTAGTAEQGTTRPVPADGRFRMGSITKTFLATVVLQLAAEDRLALDDSVERWLPGTVPGGERITLRHLLNHTSGLYDYKRTLTMPPSPAFLDDRLRTWTASELVDRAVAQPPTSTTPGTAYAYSNTDYVLLGQIVEQATGRSYADEITARIIRPLGLHSTSVPGTSPRIPGPHPHGYVPVVDADGMRLVDYTVMNPSLMGASGEMISTTHDLNRFVSALLGGRLLPDDLLDEMRTPGLEHGTYGLGLTWRTTACGVPVYGNDGDALAYQTWSFTTADGRRTATVALTPDFRGDAEDAVDAFLDRAFCG
ncbi:serine hydrolase domain-containing protein [Streptomyces sp. NPDC057682]|uniref:serine hydrolase domain-containing protein n=1 Tax=Streptomyces sp. NPDC057682 TaxID=3346210 RepID=UPI00368C5627